MKRFLRRLKKNAENGSGEIIGFITLAPAILVMLAAIITMVKYTSLRQKMEYSSYVACRAAVVADTLKDAEKYANQIIDLEISSYSDLFDIKGYKIEMKPYNPGKYPEPEKIKNIDTRTNEEIEGDWKKGNFVDFKLTVYINKTNRFLESTGERTCELTMAIEKEVY